MYSYYEKIDVSYSRPFEATSGDNKLCNDLEKMPKINCVKTHYAAGQKGRFLLDKNGYGLGYPICTVPMLYSLLTIQGMYFVHIKPQINLREVK